MGALRVTQGILVQRTLLNIHDQQRDLLDLQTQLASGLRVNAPSDDPIDSRRAVNTRNTITKTEQYLANLNSGEIVLRESATTMQTVHELIARCHELTIQGANSTYAQEQLDAIAQEIDQLLENLLDTSNHQTADRYIFGGTRTKAEPFVATRDANGTITAVTYEGNSEYIEIGTGDGQRIAINEPGGVIFGRPVSGASASMFEMMINIRDDLLAGNQGDLGNIRLDELDQARKNLGQALARVGSRQNRAERAVIELDDFVLSNQELLSDSIDADFADTIVNLNSQSNAFQAALSAGARVIQPSLLDFVR